MGGCQKWKPIFVILVVYFFMAVMNILLKKAFNDAKNLVVVVTYRLTAATIFLTPIAYFCERKSEFKLTITIICQIFFSALMGATITQYFFLIGMQYTSAAFATAFTNMMPVCTFLLALPLRQESVNLRSKGGMAKVVGSLICMGGAVLLILYRGFPLNKVTHTGVSSYHANNLGSKAGSSHKWIFGSIFLVLSVFIWAGWFLLQARIGKNYPCKYRSTAIMSAFGAIQSTVLCFAINRDISAWILKGKLEIFTVLFALKMVVMFLLLGQFGNTLFAIARGIFGSGLCYVGISWSVEQKGAVFAAAFSPFIQIFVLVLDIAFFHEQIYFGSVIGSVLVVCGLYILLWGKSKAAAGNATKPAEAAEHHGSSAVASRSDVTQSAPDSRCHC